MLIKSKKIEYVEKQTQQLAGFVQADYVPAEEPKKEKASPVSVSPQANHRDEQERQIRAAQQDAYDRGLAEGMIRGSDVEKKKLQTTLKAFEKGLYDLSRLKSSILENQENDILSLAMMVAEKIIHQEVMTDRNVYLSVLRGAVRNILDKEGIKIHLSVEDYDHMLEVSPDFLVSFEGVRNPTFERDETLLRGDVIVETMFGEVDARLNQQLEEIASAFVRKG